jgi:hypothetical protein
LPWKGEQVLGMQQLYSSVELPDPREVDPSLPPGLTALLRRVTAAEPKQRPESASEVLARVSEAFGFGPSPAPPLVTPEVTEERHRNDAILLLKHAFLAWDRHPEKTPFSLTRFAVVDEYLRANAPRSIPGNLQCLMLQTALAYGHREADWWQRTEKVDDRLSVAMRLVEQGNPAIGERILTVLMHDPDAGQGSGALVMQVSNILLDLAASRNAPSLQRRALQSLRRILPSGRIWQETALGAEQDRKLAALAVPDSDSADDAARLIGHLRSDCAVRASLAVAEPDRSSDLLLAIQEGAGSLPASVPPVRRTRIAVEWILQRLALQPLKTLLAYASIFLGSLLGFGLLVLQTLRMPESMGYDYIVISLERGAFMGAAFGFGILLTRLLMERLGKMALRPRLGLSILAGGLVLATAFVLWRLLVLKGAPISPVLFLGSLLIACGFAFATLLRNPLLRSLLCLAALGLSLGGAWWLFQAAGFDFAPLVNFEESWSPLQVLGTLMLVGLPIAILGNLVRLTPQEK